MKLSLSIFKIFLTLGVILTSFPMRGEDTTRAILKAEYDQIHMSKNENTGQRSPYIERFILQIAPNRSYYFDPQTFFVDSLSNDPQGKILLSEARDAAYKAFGSDPSKRPFETLKAQGFIGGSSYRCLKDFQSGSMRVWTRANGDRYRYDVEMDDQEWTPIDSVKTIMGYECQLAETNYHGRKWRAWYAPEVSISDGPWQLFGLPGLIMEAYTPDGIYRFQIQALQRCDEPLKRIYEDKNLFLSKRKNVLKLAANSSKNRSARIRALTNGAVNLKQTSNEEDELMELDYK